MERAVATRRGARGGTDAGKEFHREALGFTPSWGSYVWLTTWREIGLALPALRVGATGVDRARSSRKSCRSVPPLSSRLCTSRPDDRESDSDAIGPLRRSSSWKVDSFDPSSPTTRCGPPSRAQEFMAAPRLEKFGQRTTFVIPSASSQLIPQRRGCDFSGNIRADALPIVRSGPERLDLIAEMTRQEDSLKLRTDLGVAAGRCS
jgi:hypothetical protein